MSMYRTMLVLLGGGFFVFAFSLSGTGQEDGSGRHPLRSESTDRYEITDDLSLGGSIRLRGESKDNFDFDSNSSSGDDTFLLSQFRMHLDYRPSEVVRVYLEGQDARVYDGETIDEDAVPNLNEDPFDLHQGFVDLNITAGKTPLRLRTGRQKMKLGDRRVISSLGWSNTNVTWDGLRATLGSPEEQTLDVFAMNGISPDPNAFNDWSSSGNRLFDSEYAGLYYSNRNDIDNGEYDLYWLIRDNDDADDEVHTFGLRAETKRGPWDVNGEGAYQTGDFGGRSHRAFAVHLEGGYRFEDLNDTRIGAIYDMASGDGDPSDGQHETFDNIYYIPLNHAYYGYMDFFSWQNLHHGALTVQTPITKQATIRLAWHEFWLDEPETDAWYDAGRSVVRNAGGSPASSHVGSELDFTIKYRTDIKGRDLNVLFGYSRFFTASYVAETGPEDDPDYFYLQTRIEY